VFAFAISLYAASKIIVAQRFVVKPIKCVFGKIESTYYDHEITSEGVKMHLKKIEAMKT
jgi:hypothetical protein